MSICKNQNIKNVQTKLKLHIDELEDLVKYDKSFWENYNSDKVCVKNIVEAHHFEIFHHIEQIKHHLEKVSYHKKKLDDIEHTVNNVHKTMGTPEQEGDGALLNQGDAVKRPDDEKLRVKYRRVSKASPLKYVFQWENLLEEQKEQKAPVQYRSKFKSDSITEVTTSQMVKNRIQKFEGFHKPKRQSSTIETFLDFSGEKPRRIKSYPIIEDSEGEKESDASKIIDSNNCCEHETVETINDDFKDYDVSVVENSDDNVKSGEQEENCVVFNDNNHSVEYSTKPRIIEMHYKQQSSPAEHQ